MSNKFTTMSAVERFMSARVVSEDDIQSLLAGLSAILDSYKAGIEKYINDTQKVNEDTQNQNAQARELLDEITQHVGQALAQMRTDISENTKAQSKSVADVLAEFRPKLQKLDEITALYNTDFGTLEAQFEEFLKQSTPSSLRDKLESLKDDERLDIKAIRGLDDYQELKTKLEKSRNVFVGGGKSNKNDYTETLSKQITQLSHGLSVGDWVYYDGNKYTKSKTDAIDTSENTGVVSSVTGTSLFTLVTSGFVDFTNTGYSPSFTPGANYFVSDSTAGAITTVDPNIATNTSISKPVFFAVSTNTGYVNIMRGLRLTGGGATTATGSYTPSATDEFVEVDSTSGAVTITLSSSITLGHRFEICWIAGDNPVTITSPFGLVDMYTGANVTSYTMQSLNDTARHRKGTLRYQLT